VGGGGGGVVLGGGWGAPYTLARGRYPGGCQNLPICLIISAPGGRAKNRVF
jgi:hypothetical protein